MTEQIKITPGGEAIIPRGVCERLHWTPGTEVDLEAQAGQVLVKSKAPPRERITWEEFRRRVPPHQGPPVSIEEMNEAIDLAMAERWSRKEANSR